MHNFSIQSVTRKIHTFIIGSDQSKSPAVSGTGKNVLKHNAQVSYDAKLGVHVEVRTDD